MMKEHLGWHEVLQPGSAVAVANNLMTNMSDVQVKDDIMQEADVEHWQLCEIGRVSNQQPVSEETLERLV
jgi:hypothetical protein